MAITATLSAAFCTNAADANSFKEPTFYFKGVETDGVEELLSGLIYVNQKKSSTIPAAIYIKDEDKVAGQVFVKWASKNKSLELKNITGPVAKYGATPYKEFTSDDSMNLATYTEINGMGANYSSISSAKPMAYTAEKSDAYPMACFDAVLTKDAACGSYSIDVINDNTYFTSVVCRPTGDGKFKEVFPAENSEALPLNVSDRKLGDLNDDSRIDSNDASNVLKAYAKNSSNQDSGLTAAQTACADVNGDGKIDSVDASKILAYYAYASTTKDDDIISLNNFIKGKK